jgi:hypothetical protein
MSPRALLALGAVLLPACGPPAAKAAPRVEEPRGDAPAATAASGAWSVGYSFTYESSCSQSWDLTTWKGRIDLVLSDDGTASLSATTSSQSLNPDGKFVSAEKSCAWSGTYGTGRGRTLVDLAPVPGQELEFECDVESWPTDEPRALDPVALACTETEMTGLHVLACAGEGMLPRVLRNLLHDDTLYLASEPGVEIVATDGDNPVGPTWTMTKP